jgi:hypothetical protein
MEFAKELEATLREFAAAEPVEVRENGGRVAPLAGLSWEVRGAAEKPLLHLRSSEYNLTRRVLAITDHSEQRLILARDLEHSLSGNYVRGILRRGSAEWAVLGVADSESADTVENSLTFALLWLERARQSSRRGTIAGL